jgi:hypothetical protein
MSDGVKKTQVIRLARRQKRHQTEKMRRKRQSQEKTKVKLDQETSKAPEKLGQYEKCLSIVNDLRNDNKTPVPFASWDEDFNKTLEAREYRDSYMCMCFSRILLVDSLYSQVKKTLHQTMIEKDGSYYKYSITQGRIFSMLLSSLNPYLLEPLSHVVFYYY